MLVERFLRYVQIDTQSNAESTSTPSTLKQLDLSKVLVSELKEIGLAEVELDEYGYVYATIPSNIEDKNIPTICFCSHVDTAPASSGTNVKPILHKNYDGGDIILPDDTTQIINTSKYPYLKNHIGKDIITASGLTLLGADDKSGVAIIMQLAENLQNNPDIKHGEIKILFTPDEEIGLGAEYVNIQKLGAKFGYTLDGGDLGDYEDETFNADGAHLTINGVSAHTGDAKGKMINALKLAAEILRKLPNDFAPEHTSGREGFIHADEITGNTEQVKIEFILRDFDIQKLENLGKLLKNIIDEVVSPYENASYKLDIYEQYRNMRTIIEQYPDIRKKTEEAYKLAEIPFKSEPIRGGTDGSRLSYMGLPCPNIFTGMQAIHSKHEWIGVYDMEKSLEVLTHLVQIWAKN
ncbi:peptidase T [Rhizosphaericola mali]|uniref:Peptidase T n=1 Tax=Rhizosphaericola mali TaxID=2545455 RepID=A0A5P2FZM0_9BACT|nr:peptidase T [Rhizosphaericola mali]QES88984.1 peptidase T [Rhizosphaericola mali]